MIALEKRVDAFAKLGNFLSESLKSDQFTDDLSPLSNAITTSNAKNPWFTIKNIRLAIQSIAESMTEIKLQYWLESYRDKLAKEKPVRTIGVIMAGNIPLVGFHDFLCVLMSGNRLLAKMSSDDDQLLPAIAEKLVEYVPEFRDSVVFEEGMLHDFDAIIATGSNNTSRYFDYYFGKYPHIIRKNRNGVAILTGDEQQADLEKLGEDVFQYFGMGCRNVSKLYVPVGYDLGLLFRAFEKFKFVSDHYKYNNNYEYYKSIYLINSEKHFDNGFILMKEDLRYSSPPSVVYFEYYKNLKEVEQRLETDRELIQCVVGDPEKFHEAIPFGKAQHPELWDYADGIDTMKFITELI